jgi:hypothetical protein
MAGVDVTLQKNNIDVEITVPSKTVDITISGVKGDTGATGATGSDATIGTQRLYQTEYDGGAATTNATLVVGRVYLQLIHIPKAIKVDAIVISSGSSTINGNLRVGIYGPVALTTDTASGASLIVESASVAQANNAQTITFTETTLQAGKYYLAFQTDSSTGIYLRRSSNVVVLNMTGFYDRSGGYGAFTNPAPSFTGSTVWMIGMYLRCSGTP